MKKLLFALLAVAVSPPLFAQESGTITSTQCIAIDVKVDKSTVGIQVTGTWSGTLQPQVSIQGQAAANAQVTPSTSTTPQATITGNGLFYANVGGAGIFQICGNTVASGTANIFLNGSKGVNASTLGGGGGGSGTVTNTGGALTLNSPVLGAGGADTKVSTGITSNGVGEVDLGVNGGAAGVLGLNGSTSGKVTITAPAVVGAAAGFTFSHLLAGPNGSASNPTFTFSPNLAYGAYFNSSIGYTITANGADVLGINGVPGVLTTATSGYRISNAGSPLSGNGDVGIGRAGVGVLTVDGGTIGNEAGFLRSANTCRITADVSLTVNTANSFCSFSLPAVAKAWAFRCDIQWAITAGSGTNTFALGVNPSQTPTGTTNAEAQVYTATSGTQTMGSAAISASGATNILTGATYTPGATVQSAKISGTLLASGTAGTFAITAAANGTTATAAVKAGSACWLN